MIDVAILVPRRPDGGRRDQLWEFCRRRWEAHFPEWPIFEADAPGPFNRGEAINRAAVMAGERDVFLVIDSDVAIEPSQVTEAVEQAAVTGRMTFPFTRYLAINNAMTDRALSGFTGSWAAGVKLKMATHVSSVLAVPAALWAEVDGFDHRCWGWGHDDGIFTHVCRVLGGGINRVPGDVWHLEHPVTPHANKRDAGNRAAGLLAKRYYRTWDPDEMRAMVAERQVADAVTLVVLTHGRRDCISKTIPAALANLQGLPVTHIIVSDDSGDVEYGCWLRRWVPGAEVISSSKSTGFAGNVRRAWDAALGTGTPWIFWLEDDFEILQPIPLDSMSGVMLAHPHLTQMLLKRQPWFPNEVEAGDLIAVHPDAEQAEWDGLHWVEHAKGHWTNPHLVRREFLAEHTWPTGGGSEAVFGRQVMRGGRKSAFWGKIGDPPLVNHMGERTGHGY